MLWIASFTILIASYLLWTFLSLLRHYNQARLTKLPIVISPADPLNPLWLIAGDSDFLYRYLRHLPFGLGRWSQFVYMTWSFRYKYSVHEDLGPAIVLVTPGRNWILLADQNAVATMLYKRKIFVKPAAIYDSLNVFGK